MDHKWYKGDKEQYGSYVYRDDQCLCSCIRRIVLNSDNKEEIESYTINDIVTIKEPLCLRKKRSIKKAYTQESRYYSFTDGVCCLSNPNVWEKMKKYVIDRIFHSSWINNKNYVEPEEILSNVYLKTKDIPGKECTFLIKKINVEIQTQWVSYLKTSDPTQYQWLLNYQKQYHAEYYKSGKVNKDVRAKAQKRQQQKLRTEGSIHYIMNLVYSEIRIKTGQKLSYDEIRLRHQKLIQQKTKEVKERLLIKDLKNELEEIQGKSVKYGLSEFILTYKIYPRKTQVIFKRSDYPKAFTKSISEALEYVKELTII